MGSTIWILEEAQEEDDWDHTCLLMNEKALNHVCQNLRGETFSQYLDFSIEQEDFGIECEANYFPPDELLALLSMLYKEVGASASANFQNKDGLLEELENGIKRVELAKLKAAKVRFAVIP